MCTADDGALWGVRLCGPLIVVDPATRAVWATQADAEGVLQPGSDDGGWTGTLPAGVTVANTAVDWGGVRWIMVLAPLPEQAEERRVLVAHEAWHRIQSDIGLPAQPADAAHLDTEEGRRLLRLEMRALSTALLSNGRARRGAVRDALQFRAFRISRFPGAAAAEASLDRNEGLAAYTGVKLGAAATPDLSAARILGDFDRNDSFPRTYAYATGPAYGLLLDAANPNWRRTLGGYAPADLLAQFARPERATAASIRVISERYSGGAIAAEERARAERQEARIDALRQRFSGARIEIPLRQAQMEFDPNQIVPIEGLGNYYQRVTLRDAWGELAAIDGAVISSDFSRLIAAAPAPSGLSGPGWTLTLLSGYRIDGPDSAGVSRVSPATGTN
ncbi:MAG: hypothetical protein K2P58_10755 [Hyphomonadaceae bacterium]|nr:hypothetical protein [Hyphomonadaceae bacterium]